MTTEIGNALGIEIYDNFCSRFEEIERESETAFYKDYTVVSQKYRGICVRTGRSALEKEFLGRFSVKFEYFRKYEEGVMQDTFIHSDAALSDYTAVLSLKDDNGSLAFWRHKETGLMFPDNLNMESLQNIFKDGLDDSGWEMVENIPMIKNRCVIYPAKLFHSRYPKDWLEKDPRIVLVFFMDKSQNF